jgi:hypothetical protein
VRWRTKGRNTYLREPGFGLGNIDIKLNCHYSIPLSHCTVRAKLKYYKRKQTRHIFFRVLKNNLAIYNFSPAKK